MSIQRHKVFISYYHKEDQWYKNELIRLNEIYKLFEDYSVGDEEIDDTNMTAEQIRRKIRDEYMKQATVLILLCGKNTKYRKHIDWEIHTAMYDSDVNPQMGILVINLPNTSNHLYASNIEDKQIINSSSTWFSISAEDYHKYYPDLPERIIDNLSKNKDITVVDWDNVSNDLEKLIILVDCAFIKRKNIVYDHSRPLRKRNS